MPEFTKDQLLAIETRNKNILVSAAAGSGKTAVLVERIIGIITNEDTVVDIDKLLVVTFTEAAAMEMKHRISIAIEKGLNENPLDSNLQNQLLLLNKSNIMTIHGFCNKIIRNYFHLLSLDPTYRVGDALEMKILKKEVITEVLESKYQEKNVDFLKLVESLSFKYNDEKFKELIISIYDYISGEPYPHKWLAKFVDSYNIENGADFENSSYIKDIKSILTLEINHALELIDIACLICNEEFGPLAYLEALENDKKQIENALSEMSVSFSNFLFAFKHIKFSSLRPISKKQNVDDLLKTQAMSIRDDVKKLINKLAEELLPFSLGEISTPIKNLYPLVVELSDIVNKFTKSYDNEKRERSTLDYSDLEHYALKILYDENNNYELSEASAELREHFHEILTDEYQDSSYIQELILNAVSNSKNRFMVGDVKQSIYKFRMAKPEIFLDKYRNYSTDVDDDNFKIHLSRNFRSRYGVLHGINFIFYQLMQSKTMEIDYTKDVALIKGSSYEDYENESIKTILISTKKDDTEENNEDENKLEPTPLEMEAICVAKEILNIMETEKVFENNEYRKPVFSDFAILMWSVSGQNANEGEVFSDILKSYNIPTSPIEDDSYFKTYEVETILSFLEIIDNPLQDIPLASVLYSPIYNFTANDLLTMKSFSPDIKSYYENCRFYANNGENECLKNKINSFLDDLAYFRKTSLFISISKLIFEIYYKTDFINLVKAMNYPENRVRNLKTLADKASNYEKTSMSGLFYFIKYVDKLRENTNKTTNSTTENDFVEITTIHKSKGLEFPFVFLTRTGKKFNKRHVRDNLLLHQDLGIGLDYVDLDLSVKYKSLPKYLIRKKMDVEQSAETLRLLYVAMTRAKEKLIVTGTLSGSEKVINKKLSNWSRYNYINKVAIPTFHLVKANTFLDFLMPCIFRHFSAKTFLFSQEINISSPDDIFSEKCAFEIEFKENVGFENLEIIENCEVKNAVSNPVDLEAKNEYLFSDFINVSTKVSISEIKRLFYEMNLSESKLFFENEERHETSEIYLSVDTPSEIPRTYKKPSFLREKKSLSPAEKGTALHTVMEHLSLEKHSSLDDIENLIENLVLREILAADMAKSVDRQKVLNFINSDIGKRLKKSSSVQKESPFILGLEPCELYEITNKSTNDKILIHGIIDCFFEEDGEIVLLDYKSDRIPKGGVDELKKKHKLQLSIYKRAIESEYNVKVKESFLYLFSIDDAILIN